MFDRQTDDVRVKGDQTLERGSWVIHARSISNSSAHVFEFGGSMLERRLDDLKFKIVDQNDSIACKSKLRFLDNESRGF